MPRLLTKLIQRIKTAKDDHTPDVPRRIRPTGHSRRVIPKALPPPSFSPRGRKRSILLDESNPITARNAYVQHKADGPIVPSAAGRGRHANINREVWEMTDHECQLWSNPYLRMLGSPLRQCLVTQKHLPVDFMVRMGVLQVRGSRLSRSALVLLPDGVEHPRFRRRNSGRGYYLTSHKVFVNDMVSRSSYKRIPVSKLQIHSLLTEQISHQLRLRVLQEIELMTESLRCTPQTALENTVIRRLTRSEWAEIKTSGRVLQLGAVAVLVVPPLNKRCDGENSDGNRQPSRSSASLPPLSVLHRTQNTDDVSAESLVATPQVPLYNGLALFPSRPMRSKLYKALQNALLAERKARWRQALSSPSGDQTPRDRHRKPTKDKASHAYLLRSDGNTVRRADSVPLAIALWRIRMWEGQGWEDEMGSYGGWEAKHFSESDTTLQS